MIIICLMLNLQKKNIYMSYYSHDDTYIIYENKPYDIKYLKQKINETINNRKKYVVRYISPDSFVISFMD